MSYSVYNNGKFATRDGVVASGSVMNPDVNGGAIKTNYTTPHAGLKAIHSAQGQNLNPKLVPNKDFGPADVGSFRSITGVTSGNGLQGLTKILHSGHGLVVNQVIFVTDTSGYIAGPARVYSVDPHTTGVGGVDLQSSGFIINRTYDSHIGTVTYAVSTGTFASMEAGAYIAKKLTANVHGLANTKLSSGAADYGRDSIHKMNAARVQKVATAIRSGYWNPFSGRYTTAPSTANDYAAMGTDNETINIVSGYTLGGEFTYAGPRTNITGNYEAKTT